MTNNNTNAPKTDKARKGAGLALGAVGNLSQLMNGGPSGGKAIEIPVSNIQEDPDQPRKTFNEESLRELAASIAVRGVKTPISVKPDPERSGHYIINHGARRYRATILAGRPAIPAFIDTDYNRADQVIENLHRDNLTAREIADYIGRRLSEGAGKKDIADELSKSPAFVSQHVTLLDLPDEIAELFSSGRVSDVTVINELVRLFKRDADGVRGWLANPDQDITRGTVAVLKEYIDARSNKPAKAAKGSAEAPAAKPPIGQPEDVPLFPEHTGGDGQAGSTDSGKEPTQEQPAATDRPEVSSPSPSSTGAAKASDPDKFKTAIVCVEYAGESARLMLTRRPSQAGYGWIKYDASGEEQEVPLSGLLILQLIEG